MALRRKRAVGAVLAAAAVTLAGCAQDSDNAQNAYDYVLFLTC